MTSFVIDFFMVLAALWIGMDFAADDVKNGKEFKLNDSLYKCEKIRELTELEK
jgi:hypothetical protein